MWAQQFAASEALRPSDTPTYPRIVLIRRHASPLLPRRIGVTGRG